MFNKFDNQGGGFKPREMVQGNWKCSNADKGCPNGPDFVITQMPFEPTPGRDIFCKECFKKIAAERGPRPNRY